MAKICDRVDPFVLWEEAPGKLLWELEQGRPSLESIQKVLGEFVAAIGKVKLVHGDLRAWNVFFDDATKRYSVIDWGFSCFVGEPKSGDAKAHITGRNPGVEDEKVDEVDLRKTIESLKDPDRTERIWNLPPKILTWRPQAWNASRT
jgi:tRNA A-37 threonylcarbamoyl transferase component Bud32